MELFTLEIEMDEDTVTALTDGNFALYGLRAVATSAPSGEPTIWFNTTDFGLNMSVSWVEQYSMYTSKLKSFGQNTIIRATNNYPASLGEVLTVTNRSGVGDVAASDEYPAYLAIDNQQTSEPFIAGICTLDPSGDYQPSGAFKLYGHNLDLFQPITKAAFFFASAPHNNGTVIQHAVTQGFLVDFTGSPGNAGASVQHQQRLEQRRQDVGQGHRRG